MKRSELVAVWENLTRYEGVQRLTIAKLERALVQTGIEVEDDLSPIPPSQQGDQSGLD